MKQNNMIIKEKKVKTKSRLSNTKVKQIEKGFMKVVEATRDAYLSKELDKYRNIKVIYG